MTNTIKVRCQTCGGYDLCELEGKYIQKHECVHPNAILLRIAEALEKRHCDHCECVPTP